MAVFETSHLVNVKRMQKYSQIESDKQGLCEIAQPQHL